MVKRLSKQEKLTLSSEISESSKLKNHTEIYDGILNKTEASFQILNDVFLGRPKIEYYSTKPKPISSAKYLKEIISNKHFEKLLESFFHADSKIIGSSVVKLTINENQFKFNELRKNEMVLLSVFMLNLSLNYLQQSFSSTEYEILRNNLKQITKDIQNLVLAYEEKEKLKKDVNNYKELVSRGTPSSYVSSENYYAICIFCYNENTGKSLLKTIKGIEHTSKCKYVRDKSNEEEKFLRWIRVTENSKKLKQQLHDEILGIKRKKSKTTHR